MQQGYTFYIHQTGSFDGLAFKGLSYQSSCYNLEPAEVAITAIRPNHISKVMAIVGSKLPVDGGDCAGQPAVGYAPGATLLMANATTESPEGGLISDWVEAAKWALSEEVAADIISMSFHPDVEADDGYLCSRDVFFDWVASCFRVAVFTSAGNEGCLQPGCVAKYAAGKGYNFLGVGDVENTAGAERCTKGIVAASSWKNPITPNSDRELPEIAAPGSRYALAGTDFGGTSAATPAVAGIAALLMEAEPDLKSQPEAVRALLLATADYQLSDELDWDPSPECDGHDGTGLVNADEAYLAALVASPVQPTSHGHAFSDLSASSFRPGEGGPTIGKEGLVLHERRYLDQEWSIEVKAGQTVRAAIAWSSDVDSPDGPSVLEVDLDLELVAHDDSVAASGITCDNSYELGAFQTQQPGIFTLRVFGYDIPDDLESFLGVAWSTSLADCGRVPTDCMVF